MPLTAPTSLRDAWFLRGRAIYMLWRAGREMREDQKQFIKERWRDPFEVRMEPYCTMVRPNGQPCRALAMTVNYAVNGGLVYAVRVCANGHRWWEVPR